MVQIVENWAELRGRVEGVTSSGDGVVDLSVEVADVAPVAGYPNLLAEAAGQTIRVTLPLEGAPAPRPGDELRCLVRKAGPDRYFARPAPGPPGQ